MYGILFQALVALKEENAESEYQSLEMSSLSL